MELRKLQLVGRASFSVTLPPDWIKENKLKPSDQITITQEEDGSLKLVPGIAPEKKKFEITIDADRCKEPGLLKRLIVGAYIRGCDSIEVVSKHGIGQDREGDIKDTVNGLLGLGIVEATSDHIIIQSLIDHARFPVKPLLKRLYELASSMHRDTMHALKDRDSSLAADIVHRENEVNKVYWLVVRQLEAAAYDKRLLKKVGLNGEARDPIYYRAVAVRMKSAADSTIDIANCVLNSGKKEMSDADLQKVIRLGELSHEVFSDAWEAFFKEDVLLANSVIEAFYHLEKRKEELAKEVAPRIRDAQLAMCLMTIIRSLRTMAECGRGIANFTMYGSITDKGNLP